MTRTVRDAAILLGVIAKPDYQDAQSVDIWTRYGYRAPLDGYEKYLKIGGFQGARIGILSNTELMPLPGTSLEQEV